MSFNRKDNFALCPERTVQWRALPTLHDCDGRPRRPRSLWRTSHCEADRWHYLENPCNCAWPNKGTPHWFYRGNLGYALELAVPETGTWRRDAQSIASATRAFREQIRQQRELEAAARAAMGPQDALYQWQRDSLRWLLGPQRTVYLDIESYAGTPFWREKVEINRAAMTAKYGQRTTLSGGRANFQNLPRPIALCTCCSPNGAVWPARGHWYRT